MAEESPVPPEPEVAEPGWLPLARESSEFGPHADSIEFTPGTNGEGNAFWIPQGLGMGYALTEQEFYTKLRWFPPGHTAHRSPSS